MIMNKNKTVPQSWLILFFLTTFLLVFINLGIRPFFGVEGRWAEAVREMILRKDWFVPTINFEPHLTKPLVPFWLIKLSALIFQKINEGIVRFPGALCGFFSVFLFYFLSKRFFKYPYDLISTGLFFTSWGFLEFSRLAQSEIFQLFGIIWALTAYIYYREKISFTGYFLFWLGIIWGALSKGHTAFAVMLPAFFIEIVLNKRFYHLNWKNLLAFLIAFTLYIFPFLKTASEIHSDLPFYLLFKENLKQAINPYDNLRPFYIYLYYWPIWIAPWSLFLIGAIYYSLRYFKNLNTDEKFIFLSNLAIFIIFTLAKARRGYYILPILPYTILLVVYYLQNPSSQILKKLYFKLSYIFPIILILCPLILLKLKLASSLPGILIYLPPFLGVFSFLLILLLKNEKVFFRLILQVALIELIFFGFVQPYFSSASEKETGNFIAKIKKQNPDYKICSYSPFGKPVANVYFYAGLNKRIPDYKILEEALSNCGVLIVRKKLDSKLKSIVSKQNLKVYSFKAKKDKSKSYYIILLSKSF